MCEWEAKWKNVQNKEVTERNELYAITRVRFVLGDFFTTNCEKGNDIMIMELESVVDDVEGANYACLPFLPETVLPSGGNVTSFGWGSDPGKGFDHSAFPMIQILTLVPESIETCSENWGTTVPFDSFCTAEEDDKNVCSVSSLLISLLIDPFEGRQRRRSHFPPGQFFARISRRRRIVWIGLCATDWRGWAEIADQHGHSEAREAHHRLYQWPLTEFRIEDW